MNKLLKFLLYTAAISLLLLGIMTLVFNIPKKFENELINYREIEKIELSYRGFDLPVQVTDPWSTVKTICP